MLAVFTVAAGTLTVAQYSSWQRSAHDQAAFATGADVRVDEPVAVPLGTVAEVTRARGVTAATPASVVDGGSNGELLAVDARTAPATVLLRPDLTLEPGARLWRRILPGGPRPGLPVPGRPARLEALAGLTPGPGAALRPASADLSVQDASGAVYSVPAGALPADGQVHDLIALLSSSRRADYPLRLLGLTLSYPLPQAPTASHAPPTGPAQLTIVSVAVAASAAGSFDPPFARGSALARWRSAASSPDLTNLGVPASGPGSPATGSQPAAGTWQGTPAGPQVLSFDPGYAPAEGGPPPALTGTVSLTAPAPAAAVPGIATQAFAGANGAAVGASVPVAVGPETVQVKVVALVTAFPTVTGAGGGVIVDQAALQEVLAGRHDSPLPVTSWWLRTRNHAAPPGLPSGSVVSTRAGQAAVLLGDPLSAAQQRIMQVVAAAMVLLAVVGFVANVTAGLRERRARSAVLSALGVAPNAQSRQLALEQLLLSLPAACAGLLAGIGLAYLLVPFVTLTANASAPMPPVVVVFPPGLVILLAAVVAAVPVLAAAAIRPRAS